MAVEGSRGASWSGEEVIALNAVWGEALLRTKPMHSRRTRSHPLHYEAEKNNTTARVVLGYMMRPAHN